MTCTPEQYGDLCELFEQAFEGPLTPIDKDPQFPRTSPQARAFSMRVLEILEVEIDA